MLHQVKAAAGSGKTYALVQAFLARLQQAAIELPGQDRRLDKHPDFDWTDILAVTFTNKAAIEMQTRVISALKSRALGRTEGPASDLTPGMARQWLETIIRNLGRLNIRTIDSLLHQIIQAFALRLALSPGFETLFNIDDLFDPLYELCITQAKAGVDDVDSLLEQAGHSLFALSDTTGFLPVKELRKNCRDVFTYLLSEGVPASAFSPAKALETRWTALREALRTAAARLQERLTVRSLEPHIKFNTFLDKCLQDKLDSKVFDSSYSKKAALSECLKKSSVERCTEEDQAAFQALQQALGHLRIWDRALRKAISLTPFIELAQVLQTKLGDFQQRTGVVSAVRYPGYVAGLLGGEAGLSEALCRLGSQLRHVMIDEFQDTSRAQWEALAPLIVEAIARRGSLFYVGDVKQAIYNWRGGDASLMDSILDQAELRDVAGVPNRSTLPMNWRSEPGLVRFNNEVFARLGQKEGAMAMAAALLPSKAPSDRVEALADKIVLAYADAPQKLPEGRATGGAVCLRTVHADTKEAQDELVKTHLHAFLFEDLLKRRRRGDMCVLVRSNEQARAVTEWLVDWNIPVVTENSLSLAMHPLIRQAVSFLSFLDFDGADLAFWEFIAGRELFGQVSGLDPDALAAWLAQPRTQEHLYQDFRQDFPAEWTRWIAPFYQQAGLMGAYDLLGELFARYRTIERNPNDELFLRRFLDTVYRAEESGALSLAAFLELWKKVGTEQRAPLPEHLDAIRVMTIHKAKGLEFPVVLVPYHNFSQGTADELLALDLADESGLAPLRLLTTLYEGLGDSYYEKALPAALERLNLLYVAWTRPVEELYGIIALKTKNAGFVNALHELLVSCSFDESVNFDPGSKAQDAAEVPDVAETPDTEPALSSVFAPPALDATEDGSREAEQAVTDSDGVAETERLMDWLQRLRIHRSELSSEGFEQRRRGTLMHRSLEQLRVTGDLEGDAVRAVQAGLRGLHNPHDPAAFGTYADVERDCLDVLRWLLSQAQLADVLARAQPEQELLDEQGDIYRVDAFVDHDTTPLVLEYKTGIPRPEHQTQLRKYLQLIGSLPGRQHQHPAGWLVYLDERRVEYVS